ncbi:MAG TPA: regulatory protein RecX [Terriglobales bacterium]|nr:regulatory protein RecX [Terriglobales bacterium]
MRKPAKKLASEDELYECAVRALGRRMRSVAELKRLLRARSSDDAGDAIESVIERLKQQRYLNDSAYAAAYASYRRENEKLGQRRVVADLKARGVHTDVIEQQVAASYAACDEQQLARDFLRRKRIAKPSSEREAARTFRTLVRAGFSMRTALIILKTWNVDDEVISALETEPE